MKKTAKKTVKKVVKRARKKVGAVIGMECRDDLGQIKQVIKPIQITELKPSPLEPYRKFMENPEKVIADVKNVMDIQGSNGNWNANEYQFGMFNGMELILSIFEGREPQYRTMPETMGAKVAAFSPEQQVSRLLDSCTAGELPKVLNTVIDGALGRLKEEAERSRERSDLASKRFEEGLSVIKSSTR